MSQIQQAADNIKSFVNKIKPLIQAAEFLEKVGSLEQAQRDAEIAKEKAYKEVAVLNSEIEKAKAALAVSQEAVEDSKLKCLKIEAAANEKGKEVLDEYKEKGEALLKNYLKQKDALYADVLNKNAELEVLKSNIVEAQKELAAVKNAVEDFKAKFANLIK